jgi:hypothetical protein
VNFCSLADLRNDVLSLIPHLPKVEVVYGIPRSGLLPASIIACLIGARLGIVGCPTVFGGARTDLSDKDYRNKLLVDDSVLSGSAMRKAKEVIGDCYTCAIYAAPNSIKKVDYYSRIVNPPRIFEWNFTGTPATPNFMFDMDGVLCQNINVFDDDGDKYMQAISNVKPLYIPTMEIFAICTNRIERWRDVTKTWLQQHEVRYKHLFMQQYPTAVERRKNSKIFDYKAQHYQSSPCNLFVESHNDQAKMISLLSNKPVLSIQSMQIFKGGKSV